MLRLVTASTRSSCGAWRGVNQLSRAARYSTSPSGGKPTDPVTPATPPTTPPTPTTPTTPATSTPAPPSTPIAKPTPVSPPTSTSTPKPTNTTPPTPPPNKKPESNSSGGQGSGKKKSGGAFKVLFYGTVAAAALATAAVMHPTTRKELDKYGVVETVYDALPTAVTSTASSISKFINETIDGFVSKAPPQVTPNTPARTNEPERATPKESEEPVVIPPIVVVEITTDPVVVDTAAQSSLPVEIVPVGLPTPVQEETAVEVLPVEFIELVREINDKEKEEEALLSQEKFTATAEEVINELINELSGKDLPVINDSPPSAPAVDFHALLSEQTAQVEALREKLQQYYQESSQHMDHKTKAQEDAYREALELRERIYRKELEGKLAQLQADLHEQYERLRQHDRNEAQTQFQQQYEQHKAELQRNMEEALKAAVETTEALFSVRLAEEINRYDSKLASELAVEDAKYTASFNERLKAVDKLNANVHLLEHALQSNANRLKTSANLHHVSAALFELSTTSLASSTRISFAPELEKLEAASKALSAEEAAVISTISDVLRPIAAEGVAPYNELTDRFKTVLASGRQAALVPEGGGIMANLVAAAASKLIIPAKGPVAGDTPEAIFAKAEYYLEHGELNEAVNQLSLLRGMPASIVRDWLQAASNRLTVENSLKVIHTHLNVLANQHAKPEQN